MLWKKKQENFKLEANIVTGKAKQLTDRERYDYWAKQILELKLRIPTQDKSGKTLSFQEQIKIMQKMVINHKK